MNYKTYEKYFSVLRMNRYLVATSAVEIKAIQLYASNIQVSQSFHPLIGVLEVVIRNCINEILSAHFQDNDWIINQKNGFMNDPSLTFKHKKTNKIITNDFLFREVIKAEKNVLKKGFVVTSGKIIAEQTMGFWTDLFEVHNYKLLQGKPIKIFTKLPRNYGRKEVNEELRKIRLFRNRINHNEPICFYESSIDFSKTEEVYQSIINIISWINPELIEITKPLDTVTKQIFEAKKIASI